MQSKFKQAVDSDPDCEKGYQFWIRVPGRIVVSIGAPDAATALRNYNERREPIPDGLRPEIVQSETRPKGKGWGYGIYRPGKDSLDDLHGI